MWWYWEWDRADLTPQRQPRLWQKACLMLAVLRTSAFLYASDRLTTDGFSSCAACSYSWPHSTAETVSRKRFIGSLLQSNGHSSNSFEVALLVSFRIPFSARPNTSLLREAHSTRTSVSDINCLKALRRKKIRVYKTTIHQLEGKTAILTNGEVLDADVIVFATG